MWAEKSAHRGDTKDYMNEKEYIQAIQDHILLWREETLYWSSIRKMVEHSSYQVLIWWGRRDAQEGKWYVVTEILRTLQDEPDYWFNALEQITGLSVGVDASFFGDAVEAWLKWGREQKLI